MNPVEDRSAWHRRASRPVVVWMVVLVVAAAASLVVDLRWLLVHIVTLGLLTNSILIWGQHFTEALLKVNLPLSARTWQRRRIGLLNVGAVLTMGGMLAGLPGLTAIGATGVAGALAWYAVDLVTQLRRALPSRFRAVVQFYAVAAVLLVVGAGFGGALAFNPPDPWPGRLLLAHLAANVLGFVAVTAVGTLITLWPTVLRTQMVSGQDRAGRRALALLIGGVVLTVTGALTGTTLLAAVGVAAHLLGLVVIGTALVACAVRKPPRDLPGYGLAAAFGWLVVADVTALALLLTQDGALTAAALQPLTPVLVVGFGLQLLVSAMSYLMPTVMGGGPQVVRASSVAMQRFGALRVALTNAGLISWLLATDPATVTISTVLTAVGLAGFLPATTHMIATHVATRRSQGAPPPARGAIEREPVTETPVADLGRRDLLEAAAGVALVVGAGVVPALLGRRSQQVAATGHTSEVTVVARGMRFVPDRIEVPRGDRLRITLRNDDHVEVHDLVVGGHTTGRLRPGATGTLVTDPVGQGTDGWCSVGQHRAMGMELVIVPSGAADPAAGGELARVSADLTQPPGEGHLVRDPRLPPLPATRRHDLELTVTEPALEVAPAVTMAAMVYQGQVMGPTLRARRGDEVLVHLTNQGSMGHSIDFHAGNVAPNEVMRTINPGESLDYRFVTHRAGIWLYHCSTMPMSAHISGGLFGAVVVAPDDLPTVDREYLLVQSEVYLDPAAGGSSGDHPVSTAKIAAEQPDFVVFNGHATQYLHTSLTARVGERVRIWLLAAGPSRGISFHVVGGQFDAVWKEGAWLLEQRTSPGGGAQSLDLAAAQGGFVEMVFPQPGRYTFVNHSFVDAERGAKGVIDVV